MVYTDWKQPGWFMVTVLPSGPLIAQSNGIMVQYVLLFFSFQMMVSEFPRKSCLQFSPETEPVLPEVQTLLSITHTAVCRFYTDQTTGLLIPASPATAQKLKYEYLQKRRPLKKRSPF